MIEIDIKLNPFGSGDGVIVIGNIFIANVVASGYNTLQDYVYMIHNPASRFCDEEVIHGVISNYDRGGEIMKFIKDNLELSVYMILFTIITLVFLVRRGDTTH